MTLIYVLAGGKSRRFGSNKAFASVAGRTLLEHECTTLSAIGDVTVLCGEDTDRFEEYPWRCLPDLLPNKGPMGGLHAALLDAKERGSSSLFLVSVDMVGYDLAWITPLLKSCQMTGAAAYKDEFWQPLFAAYSTDILGDLEHTIHADKLAMWRFLESLPVTQVSAPKNWNQLVSINTREDLAKHPDSWKT